MSDKYSVPHYLFSQLVQVALASPDPMYTDAMGRDPDATMAAWKRNLSVVVDMIAVHAWAAGCQWVLEREPARLVVTAAEFNELAKGASRGKQAQDPRD